jgi:predicted Zn-dependent protease
MSNTSLRTACRYYDGVSLAGTTVAVDWGDADMTVVKNWIEQHHPIANVRVSPRTGRSDRFVLLPNGAQLQCPDSPVLNRLPQEVPSEGFVAWLEQRWGLAIASITLIAAMLASAYFYGLPALAERVARRVPVDVEVALGRQAVAWADESGYFRPTELPEEQRVQLTEGFTELSQALPYGPHYRLEFRDSLLGANAFAYPGGTIVVTDELVKLLDTDSRILAVMAHEIGHVEMRHSLRQLLAGSAAAILLGAVTADAASLSGSVAGLPALLMRTEYSREHEQGADDYGFTLLRDHGQRPEAFAEAMELLEARTHAVPGGVEFLSTHPSTSDRIRRAREAGSAVSPPVDVLAPTIEEHAPDE